MSCHETNNIYNNIGYDRVAKLAPTHRTSYGCTVPVKSFFDGQNQSYATISEYDLKDESKELPIPSKRVNPWKPERSLELMRERAIYAEKVRKR